MGQHKARLGPNVDHDHTNCSIIKHAEGSLQLMYAPSSRESRHANEKSPRNGE